MPSYGIGRGTRSNHHFISNFKATLVVEICNSTLIKCTFIIITYKQERCKFFAHKRILFRTPLIQKYLSDTNSRTGVYAENAL